ncbi:hypothetical protein BT69DRAFT_1316047 [Atractiella rhizophila]|nr:hypothetical protein BT69DRAFT_1316047 [Atractiella rhizophila]
MATKIAITQHSPQEFVDLLVQNDCDNSKCNMLVGRTIDGIAARRLDDLKGGEYFLLIARDTTGRVVVGCNFYTKFLAVASPSTFPSSVIAAALQTLAGYIIKELSIPIRAIGSLYGPATYATYLQDQLVYFARELAPDVAPPERDPKPRMPVHLGVLRSSQFSSPADLPVGHEIKTLESVFHSLPDAERLAFKSNVENLFVSFSREMFDAPEDKSRDRAKAMISEYLGQGHTNGYFLYLLPTPPGSPPLVASFLVTGRESPKVVAIRNVFVSPSHRRQGIAERTVQHACEYWLRVREKEEVCLIVETSSNARRVYQKVGFRWDWVGWEGDDAKLGEIQGEFNWKDVEKGLWT